MSKRMRKLLCLFVSLCLGLSLLQMMPAASADDPEDSEEQDVLIVTVEETADPNAASEVTAETPAPEESAAPAESAAPEESAEPTPVPADLKVIEKVTVRLTRGPVALMPVSEIVAEVSSRNAHMGEYYWEDENGNRPGTVFETKTYLNDSGVRVRGSDPRNYTLHVTVKPDAGFVFSSSLAAYLENSPCDVKVAGDGSSATLTRSYTTMIWSPNVVKHPGDETVNEGSYVSYVSTALYALNVTWELVSPDGKTVVDTEDLVKTFPNMTSTNNGTDKISLYNLPAEINGWAIRAVFHGAGGTETRSRPSVIRINGAPDPTAAPAETAAPEETAAPAESAAPEESAAPAESAAPVESAAPTAGQAESGNKDKEEPEQAEDDFPAAWTTDEDFHWHERASDGERAGVGEHEFVWTETKKATRAEAGEEEGVCTVCGFETTRPVNYSGNKLLSSIPLELPALGILALIVILVIAQEVKVARRRRGDDDYDDEE